MNKRVKEFDIFQRTLKCRDLPLQEEEIEIFEVESEEKVCEEEEIPAEPETEVDPETLYADLECVKRQLQKLLLLLKAKFEAEPEPPAEPTLNCEEQAAICCLQKAHHQLQCQIYELSRCFKLIREELRQMHSNFCVESKEVAQLWRITSFLEYWQNGLKPDEGVCHKRYMYLLQKKAEWQEVREKICKKSRCPQLLMERYLSQEDFRNHRLHLQAELEKLKYIFVFLFEMKNPSYGDDYDATSEAQPMKQIELDYIRRQTKLNRALHDQDCKEYFKCNKIEWK